MATVCCFCTGTSLEASLCCAVALSQLVVISLITTWLGGCSQQPRSLGDCAFGCAFVFKALLSCLFFTQLIKESEKVLCARISFRRRKVRWGFFSGWGGCVADLKRMLSAQMSWFLLRCSFFARMFFCLSFFFFFLSVSD